MQKHPGDFNTLVVQKDNNYTPENKTISGLHLHGYLYNFFIVVIETTHSRY